MLSETTIGLLRAGPMLVCFVCAFRQPALAVVNGTMCAAVHPIQLHLHFERPE